MSSDDEFISTRDNGYLVYFLLLQTDYPVDTDGNDTKLLNIIETYDGTNAISISKQISTYIYENNIDFYNLDDKIVTYKELCRHIHNQSTYMYFTRCTNNRLGKLINNMEFLCYGDGVTFSLVWTFMVIGFYARCTLKKILQNECYKKEIFTSYCDLLKDIIKVDRINSFALFTLHYISNSRFCFMCGECLSRSELLTFMCNGLYIHLQDEYLCYDCDDE